MDKNVLRAMTLVFAYVNSQTDGELDIYEKSHGKGSSVKVVWFCKTLQNWKTLLITSLEDKRYYEVTYNGDKREAYIDAYEKLDNVCVPFEKMPAV